MYEDLESQKQEIERELETDVGGDTRRKLMDQLASLNKALCVEEPQDDLWDEWEADLAAGRIPDLEKGLK